MDSLFCLSLMDWVVCAMVGGLEQNEVIWVVENLFLNHSGLGGILEEFVKWVVGSSCIVSEV